MNLAIKLLVVFSTVIFSQSIPYFDSERAFSYIVKQCDMGPRYPGSDGQIKFANYLENFLKKQDGDTLIIYKHDLKHPYEEKEITLINFI